jgi:CTP:phosphocholine cytidylyltransferase-like protein
VITPLHEFRESLGSKSPKILSGKVFTCSPKNCDSVQKLAEIFCMNKNLDGECWVNMPVSSIRDYKVCVNFFTSWAYEVKIFIEKSWGKHW